MKAMKKLTKIAKVLLLMLCIFAITPIVSANAQFKDLTPMHWCYAKIMDFYERGYVAKTDNIEVRYL